MCLSVEQSLQDLRSLTMGTRYEGKLYIVGGYVRDRLLGLPASNDVDIVLEDDALELAQFLFDRGILDNYPVVYSRFGTAMVSIHANEFELVTARKESYDADTRKPTTVIRASLEEDALRRDFTVNTLMENVHSGQTLDPLGSGISDLRGQILRTPVDPGATFSDDPLRMLRAIRFAARLQFAIAPSISAAISSNLPRLGVVSSERIRDEFSKILISNTRSIGLNLLLSTGLLEQFAPELCSMKDVTQNEFHHLDVWDHTMLVLSELPPTADLVLLLAGLFHDVGKPSAKSVHEGKTHFYRHEHVGAQIALSVLNRLKYPSTVVASVTSLVRNHMRIGDYSIAWSDGAVRRIVRDMDMNLDRLFALYRADVASLAPQHRDPSSGIGLKARIDSGDPIAVVRAYESPLNGTEISQLLSIPPSPLIGQIKAYLLNEVIEGRLETSDTIRARELAIEYRKNNS